MNLVDLDATTRFHMRAEAEMDRASGVLFISARLSPHGRVEYPELLLKAIDAGTPDTLAVALLQNWRINLWEMGRDPKGRPRRKRVPYNAADSLALREFNRYYIRGVCIRAEVEGIHVVEVYRGKALGRPMSELQAHIGDHLDPRGILSYLRAHNDPRSVDMVLGAPGGSNSGLTVRLVRATQSA
ncbi:MAG TPA: hypothetical protein VKR22_02245 [Acidimicrobiales bacterium]|nr:hypothetical protein [Acidimicrobiales bacterium]